KETVLGPVGCIAAIKIAVTANTNVKTNIKNRFAMHKPLSLSYYNQFTTEKLPARSNSLSKTLHLCKVMIRFPIVNSIQSIISSSTYDFALHTLRETFLYIT